MPEPQIIRLGLAAACLYAASAALAEPLDVKIGRWEITVSQQGAGLPPPQSELEKLPPEVRSEIEAEMKRQAEAGPRTLSYESCVKQEDLSGYAFADPDNPDCEYQLTTQTPVKQEGTFQCGGATPHSGDMKVEVLSAERIKAVMRARFEGGSSTAQMSARWLGADCAGLDE